MKQGFMVNPDDMWVKAHKKQIKQNNGYCPSKRNRVPDNRCPCKEFREDGICECGMFFRDPTYIIADEVPVDREAQMEAYV